MDTSIQLEPIEVETLHVALRGDQSWLYAAREQIAHLVVTSRKLTGVGEVIRFAEPDCPGAGDVREVLTAWCSHPEVAGGMFGAVFYTVFFKNGYVSMLEGSSVEAWPNDLTKFDFDES